MKTCPQCGATLKDDALFCAECGAKLEGAGETSKATRTTETPEATEAPETLEASEAPEAAEAPESAAAPADQSNFFEAAKAKAKATASEVASEATQGAKDIKSGKRPNKKALGIAGAAVAVVAVIVAIAIFVMSAGNVPDDVVRQSFQGSSLAQSGAVSSQYTDNSPYEIKEFKVDKQEDYQFSSADERQLVKNWYGTDQMRVVTSSGKIANESFETTFTVESCFTKQNDQWLEVGSPDVVSKTTVPLKGVSSMDQLGNNANVSYSDFSSTFDESNGSFTSTATQKVTYTYWFAADTATDTQTFVFDVSSGWKAQGDATASDQQTNWTLNGKTFEVSANDQQGSSWSYTKSRSGQIVFGETAGGTQNATYTYAWTPTDGASNQHNTYSAVSLEGTASGELVHEFGNGSFTLELNDAEHSVTINCSSSGTSTVAGSGKTQTMKVGITTNATYHTYTGFGASREDKLKDTGLTYNEKA